ncbi:hypothetical protein EIP86_001446 [Pleurotus ostreatoroseus]|nr:hypothetical protein EIP86_001446 [Pleurotus ostreatoroseus]
MPSQAFYDDQYYQPYTLANQRYHQGTYPTAPTQPTPALLAGSTETLATFGTRQAWTADSQHNGSEYGSPSGTPYSEYGPSSEQDYYASSAAGTVAYPESSQRTHVSGATYPNMYNTRYANTASRIDTPEDEQVSFRYAETSHNTYSPHHHTTSPNPSETNRRTDHGSWRDVSDSSSAFDRLPSQIAASYPRTDAVSQLGGQTVPYLMARSPPTPVSPQNDARADYVSRSMGRVSPRLSAYAFASRLPGISRLGEPGNPSVVPPLIFDEEYDDESECSLPSAASDVYRSAYQPVQSPAQFSSSTSESGLSYSASIPQSGRSDARSLRESATPPPDSAASSPRMAAERPAAERSKSSHKKSKMHQCNVCNKWFPRPSGLATHMNSHSGAKPYKCPIPSCTKSFAVRSNAKRHLRTHGIFPTSEHSAAPTQFTVGFDAPIVSEVHEVGKLPAKLRWVPQSLATRTNVDFLRDAPSDSEDEYPPSCPVLSVPLPAVVPSSPKWEGGDFEERNSYEDMGPSPYLHSQQWRGLPGPAIVTPASL